MQKGNNLFRDFFWDSPSQSDSDELFHAKPHIVYRKFLIQLILNKTTGERGTIIIFVNLSLEETTWGAVK